MKHFRLPARVPAILVLVLALGATSLGQVHLPRESIGGPLTASPVVGAPFSADATTIVHATLGDGTRLDQSTTDRYYRDSAGRVRVEKPMAGLPAPATMSERHIRTIIDPEPGDGNIYTLDTQTQTARPAPRSLLTMTAGGGRWFFVPVGGVRFLGFQRAGELWSADPDGFADVRDEPLGSRRIEDVETIGRRITIVLPPGYRGNGKPIEMIDERWESEELQLLVQSWHADARSTIEYRLSNIRRTEPPANLFETPPGYTVDATSASDESWMSFTWSENPRGLRHPQDR